MVVSMKLLLMKMVRPTILQNIVQFLIYKTNAEFSRSSTGEK